MSGSVDHLTASEAVLNAATEVKFGSGPDALERASRWLAIAGVIEMMGSGSGPGFEIHRPSRSTSGTTTTVSV